MLAFRTSVLVVDIDFALIDDVENDSRVSVGAFGASNGESQVDVVVTVVYLVVLDVQLSEDVLQGDGHALFGGPERHRGLAELDVL